MWESRGPPRGRESSKSLYTNRKIRRREYKPRAAGALGATMAKKVHYRIDPNDESITLKDIMQKIQEIQRQNPDLDVFFDGDEYAICSRPKKE